MQRRMQGDACTTNYRPTWSTLCTAVRVAWLWLYAAAASASRAYRGCLSVPSRLMLSVSSSSLHQQQQQQDLTRAQPYDAFMCRGNMHLQADELVGQCAIGSYALQSATKPRRSPCCTSAHTLHPLGSKTYKTLTLHLRPAAGCLLPCAC
jgi:hypothetical protein